MWIFILVLIQIVVIMHIISFALIDPGFGKNHFKRAVFRYTRKLSCTKIFICSLLSLLLALFNYYPWLKVASDMISRGATIFTISFTIGSFIVQCVTVVLAIGAMTLSVPTEMNVDEYQCKYKAIKSMIIYDMKFKQFRDAYYIKKNAYSFNGNGIVIRLNDMVVTNDYDYLIDTDLMKYIIYFKNPIDRIRLILFRLKVKRIANKEKEIKDIRDQSTKLGKLLQDIQKDIDDYKKENIDRLKDIDL